MKNVTFYLRGHARTDLTKIRQYTIARWGNEQWKSYKSALFNKLQTLANNPKMGINIEEISPNAYRFPLKDHVLYYLVQDDKIIFVGIISTDMSPEKHILRKQDISNELGQYNI